MCLVDFPMATYHLQLDGMVMMSSKIIDGVPTFDFTGKKSDLFNEWLTKFNRSDDKDFLKMTLINNITIIVPSVVTDMLWANGELNVDYVCEKETIKETFYPKRTPLLLNHPTYLLKISGLPAIK